jgi:hypothetical protein
MEKGSQLLAVQMPRDDDKIFELIQILLDKRYIMLVII